MGSEHYCLRWNNHQSNLLGVFSQLLRDESLVDVTLACSEGHSIRAHKVVLSACSSYFQTLFLDHPSRHPIVILKDVHFSELRTLIEFMYKGEVNVEYCQLSALLKTAESLKIKGLAEMTQLGSTREFKPNDIESEQKEPKELVLKRPLEDSEPAHTQTPPRVCRSPDRPPSTENIRTATPREECGPSDMTLHSNNIPITNCPSLGPGLPTNRLPSPAINNEPIPGPSGLPPVQVAPLSLKKEADWGGGGGGGGGNGGQTDDSTPGDNVPEFNRSSHDSNLADPDRNFGSTGFERPSSAHSSRSSTPFVLPFPTLASSLLEVGLVHPALIGDEMFRCSICMAAFPSVWLLEQHTALQHMSTINSVDKPFVCEQCGQSYRYRSAYVKHREQNHRARLPADKLFSCDVCGMQFRYLKSFKKHRLNHALERLHGNRVDISGESKSDSETPTPKDRVMENSSDQVSSSNETITVDEGDHETVVKKETLSDDAGDGAVSDPEKIEADQDDTVDSIGSGMVANSSGVSPNMVKSNAETSLMSLLRTETIDRQRERRFACPFCGKCVRSKENLKLHVRKHTGERPFVCLFCGRAFGGKSDLTRHLRIHTGERPYHCDMCGKCFARADYLSKHLTTHIHTPR